MAFGYKYDILCKISITYVIRQVCVEEKRIITIWQIYYYKTGEHFELGKLAPKTYAKIANETSNIKAKISDTFGRFAPRDKETNVIYKGKCYLYFHLLHRCWLKILTKKLSLTYLLYCSL